MLLETGDLLGRLQRVGVELAEHAAGEAVGQHDRGEQPGRRPVRPLGRGLEGVGAAASQHRLGQPLEVALPHPPGRGQLVGVAGSAGRRQLVDVGEDELGEARQRRRAQAGADPGPAEVAPRDARAHSVGAQQRLHGATAAGLAPAQGVRRLGHLVEGGRRALVAVARGEVEEPAERERDGVLDGAAHLAGEGVGIARHLGTDGVDDLLGHPRQVRPHRGGDPSVEGQRDRGLAAGGFPGHEQLLTQVCCSVRTERGIRFTPRGHEFRPRGEETGSS